jgi:hypothetical protein
MSEDGKFGDGYDAIFGKKTAEGTSKPEKKPVAKKAVAKKKPAAKKPKG